MKNKLVFGFTLISALWMASCGNDDTSDIIINSTITNTTNNTGGGTGGGGGGAGGETISLSGTYAEDLVLDIANDYIVDGPMIMEAGTTLTIPAGMTIKAEPTGSDVYIAITQGARIVAEGNQDAPIIFTSNSDNPRAGDWGGLILLGKAPINSVAGSATSTSEIAGLPYGGSAADDDSGILRYVRVQYSGGSADGQSENNAFSFYGVGNGTVVEYVQAFEGKDDGFEFFGGTVNASFVSVLNAQDDSVDWTEGFTGTLTDVYIEHNGTSWDKGIEADGYNSDIGNNSNPLFFSAPNLTNVTIIGKGSDNTVQDGTAVELGSYEAVRLRVGTAGIFTNILIQGFGEAFDLDGDTADNPTGQQVLDDALQLIDITFTDVTTKFKNDTEVTFTEADLISGDGNGTGTDYDTWSTGWTLGN
ncbi:MAG TPA: multidrug transporter [Pricia sp.]|nr:multidrug transporter [Pricia sp.]